MRKQPSPLKHNLIICGIVTALCLFFLVAFRVEVPEVAPPEENAELFRMMPRGFDNNPYHKEQAARDELDDPTLMSFPNTKYGFSSVRKGEGEPPQPELPVYDFKALTIEERTVERTPLVGEYKEKESDPVHSFIRPQIDEIVPVKAKGKYSRRIVWKEDGVEKSSPFKADEILKLTENKLPKGRTVLNIIKLSDGHKIFIQSRCGIAKLDQKVYDYYNNMSLKLFLNEKNAQALPKSVTVDWRLLR